MFVVNQDGDYCDTLIKMYYTEEWSEENLDKLKSFENDFLKNSFNSIYCFKDSNITELREDYIKRHNLKKDFIIYINDKPFAFYQDFNFGMMVFNKLKAGLRYNANLIDLSDIENERIKQTVLEEEKEPEYEK